MKNIFEEVRVNVIVMDQDIVTASDGTGAGEETIIGGGDNLDP